MFSLVISCDQNPAGMAGQKSSMKSMGLIKAYFYLVLYLSHEAQGCGISTTKWLRGIKQRTSV
jgi:hypothetical protein